MAGRLDGKVALISGAARGQGRSHAVRFAEEGADIIAFDICSPVRAQASSAATADDLAETVAMVERLDRRIVWAEADVRDDAAVRAVLDRGVAELGRVDVVVANAGITPFGVASADLAEEDWQSVIDTNLTGVFNTVAPAAAQMVEQGGGGSIIMTSSSLAIRAVQGLSHYVAAKLGIVGIMRTMALELGEHSIRVNTVHPTAVGTEMLLNDANYRMFRPDLEAPTQEDALPAYRSLHVLPIPWVEAEDVTNAVLFLASDESRYVTGLTMTVDAGMTIK